MSSFIHEVGQKLNSQLRLLFDGIIGDVVRGSGDVALVHSPQRFEDAGAMLGTASQMAAPTALSASGKRSKEWRKRDSALEKRARCYLETLAPRLLPQLVIGWNPRMRTTAGVAIATRSEVWLNPELRSISEEEVDKTLLHELAHLLAQHRHGRRRIAPHGPEWMLACRDLGIPGESRTHQLPFTARRMRRNYLLRCPGCGESHERVRAPRRAVACLACCRTHNKGLYHERFRLLVTRKSGN